MFSAVLVVLTSSFDACGDFGLWGGVPKTLFLPFVPFIHPPLCKACTRSVPHSNTRSELAASTRRSTAAVANSVMKKRFGSIFEGVYAALSFPFQFG